MNRIKSLIKEKGYTLEGFSQKLGISRQSFANTLQSPSYPSLERIADALGVEMWELFAKWEDIKEKKENHESNIISCPACGARLTHTVKVIHEVTLQKETD